MEPSPEQKLFISSQQVAHLATADRSGAPHVIPICFGLEGEHLYFAIDTKPKRVPPQQLKRVRNILENPKVAVIIDRYSDDWARLGYVLIHGQGELVQDLQEHRHALALLQARYPQYSTMPLEEAPVVRIKIDKVVKWGNIRK